MRRLRVTHVFLFLLQTVTDRIDTFRPVLEVVVLQVSSSLVLTDRLNGGVALGVESGGERIDAFAAKRARAFTLAGSRGMKCEPKYSTISYEVKERARSIDS